MRKFRRLARQAFSRLQTDRVVSNAASVAFFMTLASFPGIAAVVSLARVLADPEKIQLLVEALSGIFPRHVIRVVESQIRLAAAEGTFATDEPLISSILLFAVLIWSANRGTRAMLDALNIVYDRRETRGFIRYTSVALAMTAGSAILVLIAAAAILVVPLILDNLGVGNLFGPLLALLSWPLLVVVGAGAIQILYRFGPSHDLSNSRWIGIGSLAASMLWMTFSIALSWYIATFGNFAELHGSLRAVIGFMLWLWLSTIAVLIGAEIDAGRA